MEYLVRRDGKEIGSVAVETSGLYLKIWCQCYNLTAGFHRLHMIYQDKTIILGLLIPKNKEFVLDKTIPRKSAGFGTPEFVVISGERDLDNTIVRLQPGTPIEYLETIRSWKLCNSDGESSISVNLKSCEG